MIPDQSANKMVCPFLIIGYMLGYRRLERINNPIITENTIDKIIQIDIFFIEYAYIIKKIIYVKSLKEYWKLEYRIISKEE
tara:strand:+ start:2288 stop:2530 length:243 start_codon:yes stop_codon:yes gene_type:complete